MDEERHALALEDPVRLARSLRAVGGDADIQRLAAANGMGERAHGLFERHLRRGPVRVEDVDVVETHALQALVERRQQVLARAAKAVGAGPHIPARLGGDQQLVAMAAEVLAQNLAEVLFGRAVGRTVVVGEVEVGDAAIEGATNDGAAGLEDIGSAEVLPQAQRHRGKDDSGPSTTPKLGVFVALLIGNIGHSARISFVPF